MVLAQVALLARFLDVLNDRAALVLQRIQFIFQSFIAFARETRLQRCHQYSPALLLILIRCAG